MLLTFNFKGIDELIGNPPILIDVPEDKVFKDVLLEVLEKINPLLPEGKKFTLETLGIESFDGEPVSWGTYEKHVFDVIIDFGTSFVVTTKDVKRGEKLHPDVKITEAETLDKDKLAALDLTREVLKTEGVAEVNEADIAKSMKVEDQLQLRPKGRPAEMPDLTSAPKDLGMPAIGGSPSITGDVKPSIPIAPSPPVEPGLSGKRPSGMAGPEPSGAGGSAQPGPLNLGKTEEARAAPAQPVPASMPAPAIATSSPPLMAAEEVSGKKGMALGKKDGDRQRSISKASPPKTEKQASESEELSKDAISAEISSNDDITSGEIKEPEMPAVKTQYDKSISVDYFNVMNPENYYPIVVDIADIEQAWKPVEENILTGERKIQVKEKVVFETDTVIVRPVFPGCTVAPLEREADLTKPKELLTFYATPLVRGAIKGELHFLAKGKLVHVTELPAEVKDPRLARYIFLYGLLASLIPKISELLNINLETMLNNLIGTTLILGMNLSTFVAVTGTGIAMLVGLIYFATHKPKNAKMQLHLTDFRMTLVPPNAM
ncbi:MAG: hypothetical protein Q6373_023180 [Candidatus Sigynarchaeota archaeon]